MRWWNETRGRAQILHTCGLLALDSLREKRDQPGTVLSLEVLSARRSNSYTTRALFNFLGNLLSLQPVKPSTAVKRWLHLIKVLYKLFPEDDE